jgi:hypothetical protein
VIVRFTLDGETVAEVSNPSHVPREGDWIWLTLKKKDLIYKVVRVAWDFEPDSAERDLPRQHSLGNVFVLIEPVETDKRE